MSIGIFKTIEETPRAFVGCDDIQLLSDLHKQAQEISGCEVIRVGINETPDCALQRVAEISVMKVEDDVEYRLEMAEEGRKPTGESGEWNEQSIAFAKKTFDLAAARKWLSISSAFSDFGNVETDTAIVFDQYDSKWFSEFKTSQVEPGVVATYGKIAPVEVSSEETEKAMADAIVKFDAVQKINKSLMGTGVRILCGTAKERISKADDEETEQTEERFVLSMVLEPNDGEDGTKFNPDTQGDIYSKDEVRKACHLWMENFGQIDLMHNWKAIGKSDVRILECYISPVTFKNGDDVVQEGSWMLALRIANDELWKAVKSGDIGAFSIGGLSNRVPLEKV